ncbi:MAG TPA: hypothetical protein VGE12_02835 [Noviherbaspirillum sp.]
MDTRCRAGDLAVVVQAFHRGNVGRIVEVVGPHDGTGDLVFRDAGVVWLVKCAHPMVWTVGNKRFRRKFGPVPDVMLKPIRGLPSADESAARVKIAAPALHQVAAEE